jgi:hypothetical protein
MWCGAPNRAVADRLGGYRARYTRAERPAWTISAVSWRLMFDFGRGFYKFALGVARAGIGKQHS